MKKNYQIPECVVVKIGTINIIASTTPPTAGLSTDGKVNAGSIESRRSYDDWDDDED